MKVRAEIVRTYIATAPRAGQFEALRAFFLLRCNRRTNAWPLRRRKEDFFRRCLDRHLRLIIPPIR
jgi:hypothetical protein